VHLSKEPEEELLAYRSYYLREEVQMGALVKKMPVLDPHFAYTPEKKEGVVWRRQKS